VPGPRCGVGSPNDSLEHKAEHIADEIVGLLQVSDFITRPTAPEARTASYGLSDSIGVTSSR
jgi:hypothetical protein